MLHLLLVFFIFFPLKTVCSLVLAAHLVAFQDADVVTGGAETSLICWASFFSFCLVAIAFVTTEENRQRGEATHFHSQFHTDT